MRKIASQDGADFWDEASGLLICTYPKRVTDFDMKGAGEALDWFLSTHPAYEMEA